MTSTAVQQISTEDLRQLLYTLIEDKNSEFLQFIAHKLEKKPIILPKKAKPKTAPKIEFPPKKERIPYSEMPFWKANPHLKPHVLEGKGGLSKGFWDALNSAHEAFKDVSDEQWDEVLEDLKNDR